jgi:hypothetical protein
MSRRDAVLALVVAVVGFALGAAGASTGATYAAYSDSVVLPAHVGAGTWGTSTRDTDTAQDRPDECDPQEGHWGARLRATEPPRRVSREACEDAPEGHRDRPAPR